MTGGLRLDQWRHTWREDLFTKLPWVKDETRAAKAGEAGGFNVRVDGCERPGYLKPTKHCPPGHPRAANEKIAADLATELHIPMPPVVLFRREPGPDVEELRACISLILYNEQYEWGQLRSVPKQGGMTWIIVRSVLANSSGIIAFDTLLANTDRDNDRNAIFACDKDRPADGAFLFLDYSNSMNHGNAWANGGYQTVIAPKIPDFLGEAVDTNVLEGTIRHIEQLPDETIAEIVNRIPDDYMTPEHKSVLQTGLCERRSQVRTTLAPVFGV